MKFLHLFAILSFLLGVTIAHADQSFTKVPLNGEATLRTAAVRSTVEVKIRTSERQIGKPSDPRPAEINSNCTYSRYPCSLVERIEIAVNGSLLFVPRSVFADLADLNDATLRRSKNDWILTLDGGDASESYIVKIYFNDTRIKERILSNGTLAHQPLQKTIYYMVTEGD